MVDVVVLPDLLVIFLPSVIAPRTTTTNPWFTFHRNDTDLSLAVRQPRQHLRNPTWPQPDRDGGAPLYFVHEGDGRGGS